jgi:molybdate transport system ATP-binding protein
VIQVRIAKRYPAEAASPGFALDIAFQSGPGITVLFGPSGAGKTLTLEAIAGFVKPDTGRILLDDAILFDAAAQVNLPPRRRNCGYVFQNYALFPHMTLRQNLLFGAERWPRLERHRRVAGMLERFHIEGVAGRRPHEVSGGEKQRCSIARALIGEPRLLLLDEPARGLDAPLRAELYEVLRQVRAEFDLPILLVTHDLEEAFALGEEMLIVQDGRVVQSGAPRRILDRPASPGVARLLGIPNLFEAQIAALDPGRKTSRLECAGFELASSYLPGHFRGDRVWVAVRAEDVRVYGGGGVRPMNAIRVNLLRTTERAQFIRLDFSLGISADLLREEFDRQRDNEAWLVEIPPYAVRVL